MRTAPTLAPPKNDSTSRRRIPSTQLYNSPDLDVIALVAGQENYGLAVVAVAEGLYSFAQSPSSLSHALRVLVPTVAAALVLVLGSGPLITEAASPGNMATGLGVATAVSVALGVSYAGRLAAPFAPAPKEIAALGLLTAVAGFFSFAQNLVVNGFVQLPGLPELPGLPDVSGLLLSG